MILMTVYFLLNDPDEPLETNPQHYYESQEGRFRGGEAGGTIPRYVRIF
jgi:hypothetical protein